MNSILESTIGRIPPLHLDVLEEAQQRLRDQAKPLASLGKLEEMGARLASIAGVVDVRLDKKFIITCAGDHGVVEEGVSLFPAEVTPQMVYNFVNDGASINVLGKHAGATVIAADLGVNHDFPEKLPIFHKKVAKGTQNLAKGPAMSREQAEQALINGIEIVNELVEKNGGIDILATGDMGIGNTTPSTAIIASFSGISVEELTGYGTGIDDDALTRKINAIKSGLEINKPDASDAIDVLAKVGGYEIGGLAGLVLGAASHGIPVVCDGLISTAGALIACELAPAAKNYLFASHKSVEVGHTFMHDRLGVDPLIDFGLRLGEGTGAALTLEILDACTRVLADIKTFEEVAIIDQNNKSNFL